MKNLQIVLTIIFTIVNLLLFAQNKKIDSLKILLKSVNYFEKKDPDFNTVRLRILVELSKECEPKDAIKYAQQAVKLVDTILELPANNNKRNFILELKASALSNIGMCYEIKGDIKVALEYLGKGLKIRKEIGDKHGIASSLNNIGLIYFNQGYIPKALEFYNQSLKIYEEIGDEHGIANCFNNIGEIYRNQGDFPKALEYLYKSLKIRKEIGDKNGIAVCFNYIGMHYNNQGDIPKALEYLSKSLKICEEIGDKHKMTAIYNNIGYIYYIQNNLSIDKVDIHKALEYFDKSLKICEEIGDKQEMAYSFNYIGAVYFKENDLLNAKTFYEKSYILSKELGYFEIIKKATEGLNKIYEKQGNYKLAYQYYREHVLISDSLANKENYKKALKQQVKYEYEKKAAVASEAAAAESRKEKVIRYSVIGGLVLMFIVTLVIFRSLHITRRQKRTIAAQRDQLESSNLKLLTLNEEIASQRDTVTNQKEHIERIHEELSDSIRYAERIQKAVLPVSEATRLILGEHFIIFKPKDIVSGDFYFVEQRKNILLIAVADCTGHGVPGAFISMLGISFLNEIIAKEEIQTASHVLDELRQYIINSLQQKGIQGEQQDGMDISFIAINTETNQLQFAGANNPLYYIPFESNKLSIVKADSMPVGIYGDMKPFSNNIIQLNKGDKLYIFSDGFIDQFGGENHKKFLSKRFKESLLQIAHLPMTEQKENLNAIFSKWKGNGDQIDDVTIMGIKI